MLEDKVVAKLHSCANCNIVETQPKTFKRCHKFVTTTALLVLTAFHLK